MRNCSYKKCPYPVFSTDKLTGLGYCKSHSWCRTDRDKRSPLQKHLDKAKQNTVTNNEDETELQKWYAKKMKASKRVCENCGASLEHYNQKDWHGSQHHIFEKSIFPSIQVHPLNHGVLGKWCCHSQWHTSLENAAQMPFFKIAVERFLMFEPDIKERNRIPEIYLQEINDPFE